MFPFLLFRCKKGSSSASRFSVDWLLTVLALVVWVTISSLALAQTREDGQTKSPNFTNHAGDEQARFSAERNDYWRPGRYADAAFTYSKNHDHFLGHHLSAQRKNSVRQGIGDKAGRTAQALGKRITADPWGTAEDLGKGTWNVAKSLGRSTWNAVRHPIESAQSFGQEVLTLGTTAAVNSASGMKSAWAAYRGEENALNALYGQNMGPALMGLGGIQGTLTAAQVIPAAKGAQLIGKGALYAGRKAGEKVLLQLGRKEGMQGVRASGKVAEITLGRGVAKRVTVSKSLFPESAKHIEGAVSAGKPNTLTINRSGAAANRRNSLRGVETKPGLDRDEFPPAMFQEGGKGASVRYIDPTDNRGAGACIGAQCRGLSNGTRVRIDVVD